MITQGATPKIKIVCKNFNPLEFKTVEVNIRNGNYIINKKSDNLDITNEAIAFILEQKETLTLNHNHDLEVQVRLMNNENEVRVTSIAKTSVFEFIGLKVVL